MSFRLVPKSVTLNDLERRSGVILRYLSEFMYLPGALRKSSRSLSHLLMSSCLSRYVNGWIRFQPIVVTVRFILRVVCLYVCI